MSDKLKGSVLYEFSKDFEVSYVGNWHKNDLVNARLVLCLDKKGERHTFALQKPTFPQQERNIISSTGVQIIIEEKTNRIIVADLSDSLVYIQAENLINLTRLQS